MMLFIRVHTHTDRSQQADVNNRGYLDFPQFQRFVKMLKARPELDRLYKKICSANNRLFDFPTFEVFMCNSQQVSISPALAYSC